MVISSSAEANEVFEWMRQVDKIGCYFAAGLARHTQREKWYGLRFDDEDLTLAADFARTIEDHLDLEVVLMVFPQLHGPDGVVKLVNALCQDDRWSWEDIVPAEGQTPGLLVGLRYRSPKQDFDSLVLGLGDFDPMPETRRSPHLSLIYRYLGPHPNPYFKKEPRKGIHLADIHYDVDDLSKYKQLWSSTEDKRAQVLGEPKGGPKRCEARAKVTFVLPPDAKSALVAPNTL